MHSIPALAAMACSLVAFAPAAARAQVTGEIVDWGVSVGRRGPATGRQPGEIGLSPARPRTDISYVERTDRIEARLCRSFGMTVRLVAGGADDLPSRIEVRVAHPRFTRPDGATSTEDRFRSAVVDGRSRIGFTFDHTWEMEPGPWTISVVVRGAEIASKDFTVVAPAPGSPTSECEKGATS